MQARDTQKRIPSCGHAKRPKTKRRGKYDATPVAVPRIGPKMVRGSLIIAPVVIHLVLAGARRNAEDGDGSSNRNSLEKRDSLFLRHSNTPMRCRVAWQIA